MNKFIKVVLLVVAVAGVFGMLRESVRAATTNTGVTVLKATMPEYVVAGTDATIILHFKGGPITPDQDIRLHPLYGKTYGRKVGTIERDGAAYVSYGFYDQVTWNFNGNDCSRNCLPLTLPSGKSTSQWSGTVDIPVTIRIPDSLPVSKYPLRLGMNRGSTYATLIPGEGVKESTDLESAMESYPIPQYEIGQLVVAAPCANFNYTFSKNLKEGDTNSDVTALQSFLLYKKGINVTNDQIQHTSGNFGSRLVLAVKAYQKSVGVPETGVFDAVTRAKANAECNYDRSIPTISSVTPNEIISGSSLTLQGSNFKSDSTIKFISVNGQKFAGNNGQLIVNPITVSSTEIVTRVPDWYGVDISGVYSKPATGEWLVQVLDKNSKSNSLKFKVLPALDITAPSVPSKPNASDITTDKVTLSWSDSTELPTGSGLAGYKIYKDGKLLASVDVLADWETRQNSYIANGLNSNTKYSFTVASFDKAGNISAQSEPLIVTTDALNITRFYSDRAGNLAFDVNGSVDIVSTNPSSIEGSVAYSTSEAVGFLMSSSYTINPGDKAFLGGKEAVMTGHMGLWLYVSPMIDLKYGSTYDFYLADSNGKLKTNKVKVKLIANPDPQVTITSPNGIFTGYSSDLNISEADQKNSTFTAGNPITIKWKTNIALNGDASINLLGRDGVSTVLVPAVSLSSKTYTGTIPTNLSGVGRGALYKVVIKSTSGLKDESDNYIQIVNPAPKITSVTPGNPRLGEIVTVKGSGFSTSNRGTISLSNKTVSDLRAEVVSVTPTEIQFKLTVPYTQLLIGAYNVVVNTDDGKSNPWTIQVQEPLPSPVVKDAIVPTTPGKPTLASTVTTSAILRLSPSTDNVAVTGYKVYQNGTLITTINSDLYTVTGLAANTAYSFTVAAVDAAGNTSAQSPALSVTTPASTVVTPPSSTKLAITSISPSEGSVGDIMIINGNFVGLTTADMSEGLPITNSSGVVVAKAQYISGGPSEVRFKIPNIPVGYYNASVKTSTAVSNGWTFKVTLLTDTSSPTVPGKPVSSYISPYVVNFSWSASTDDKAVTGYKIYKNGTLIGTSGLSTYSVTGLNPSTTYSFTVSAVDAAGNTSVQSPALSVTTSAPAVTPTISTPGKPVASSLYKNGVTLSWTPSTATLGLYGYKVYKNGLPQDGLSITPEISIVGLTANTAYSFTIAAVDKAGSYSTQSPAIVVTTPSSDAYVADTSAPTVPGKPTSSNITTTEVSLSWSASTDNKAVTGYKVYRNGSVISTPTSNSYSVSSLSANTNYSFTVAAVDAAGNTSTQSPALSVTTSAPAVIPKPNITGVTPGSVKYNDTVTVTGTGFTGVTPNTVFLTNSSGSTVNATYVSSSATQVVFKVPNVPAAAYNVSVIADGGTSNGWTISVTSATPAVPSTPYINSISPTSGKYGDTITLTGTNFEGVIEELLSLSNASGTINPGLVSATPTQIKFTIPNIPAGVYNVNFSADKGDSNTVSLTVTSTVGVGSTNKASLFDWIRSLFP